MSVLFETLTGTVAAIWLFSATLFASYGIARSLCPGAGLALRWTATAAIGCWILTLLFHLLMVLHAFTLPAGLALVSLAALAVHLALRGALPDSDGVVLPLLDDVATTWDALWPRRAGGRPGAAAAVSVAALVAVGFGARAASVPVLSWDSLTYHAVKAGLWVQSGAPLELAAPGGWSIYRTYLAGGEVLHAWAMLPFHADTLSGLTDAAVWLLLGVAVHALAGEAGLGHGPRTAAALYVMALPAVARTVGSLYIDNTSALLLIAALALALHAVRLSNMPSLTAGALAIATLGSAAGVKIFAAPVAALLTVALVLLLWPRARPAAGLAWLGGGAAAAALVVAPWLVRTWRLTGYPLSPLPIRLGPLRLGETNAAMRWYMDHPRLDGAGLGAELAALGKMLGLPGLVEPIEPVLGLFVLLPLVVAVPALVALARRQPRVALLFSLFIVPLLWSFYGAGLRDTRLIWAPTSGRYLIAAVAAIVVLAATALRGRALGAYGALLVVAAAAHFVWNDLRGWNTTDLAVAGAAIVVAAAARAVVAARLFGSRVRVVLACALPLILLATLHVYRERTHDRALETTMVLHTVPRYWVPGARRVADPRTPRTLAVTAGPWQDADNWLVYHFLGRRLQNELVWVSPVASRGMSPEASDGLMDMERYGDEVRGADYDGWRARLAERGVTDVLSLAPRTIELEWMERNPTHFSRDSGDGRRWGLYSVLGGAGSSNSSPTGSPGSPGGSR